MERMVERVRATRWDIPQAALYLGVMIASGLTAYGVSEYAAHTRHHCPHHRQRAPSEALEVTFVTAQRPCAIALNVDGARFCEPAFDIEVLRRTPNLIIRPTGMHWGDVEIGANGHPIAERSVDGTAGWHRAHHAH